MDPRKGRKTDPEFASYVAEFERVGLLEIDDVPITFGNPGPRRVGVCERYWTPFVEWSEVLIDRGWWERNPHQSLREVLIFHELGHCVLDLPHLDGVDDEGKPISIMQSSLKGFAFYYEYYRDHYHEDLFYEHWQSISVNL